MPKTIKISPLPFHSSPQDEQQLKQQVKGVLSEFSIQSIEIVAEKNSKISVAFVTFEDEQVLEALQFKYENSVIPELYNAQIKEAQKKNKNSGSSSDEAQQLILQDKVIEGVQFDQNAQQIIVSLTDPSLENVVALGNFPQQMCQRVKINSLEKQLRQSYPSIGRVLGQENLNRVLLQFEDKDELNTFVHTFENQREKIVELLRKAQIISIKEDDVQGFGQRWIQQQEKSEGKQSQDRKYLHEQMLPKLNKITSMQANFLQNSEEKKEVQHDPIHEEHSRAHLESQQQLKQTSSNEAHFLLGGDQKIEQEKKIREQNEDKIIKEQILRKEEQERLAKQKQEEQRIQREKEEERRRQQQQKIEAIRKQEELANMKKQKEQEERLRIEEELRKKQEEEKMRREEQERKKRQQKSREKKELQEAKAREQQLVRIKKEQEEAERQKEVLRKEEEEIRLKRQEQQRMKREEEERRQKQIEQKMKRDAEQEERLRNEEKRINEQPKSGQQFILGENNSNKTRIQQIVDGIKSEENNFKTKLEIEKEEPKLVQKHQSHTEIYWIIVAISLLIIILA